MVDFDFGYQLHWDIVGNQIHVGLQANISGGWIALGFSSDGSMGNGGLGADAWIAGYGKAVTIYGCCKCLIMYAFLT